MDGTLCVVLQRKSVWTGKNSVVKEALLFILWEFTLEMVKVSGTVIFLPF